MAYTDNQRGKDNDRERQTEKERKGCKKEQHELGEGMEEKIEKWEKERDINIYIYIYIYRE